MEGDLLPYMLRGAMMANIGPSGKEILLERVAAEYSTGNQLHSIFYQTRALYQACLERYYHMVAAAGKTADAKKDNRTPLTDKWLQQMNAWEREDIKSNPLMQYALKTVSEASAKDEARETVHKSINFLENILEPLEGVKKIEQICQQLPLEWTVVQMCKGPRSETTYSIYSQIHEAGADIYLTLFRHIRSTEYPTPLCLCFNDPKQLHLFKSFSTIADRFKRCIDVDPKQFTTKEARKGYWKILDELNQCLAETLEEFKEFFFPWNFLFSGTPSNCHIATQQYQKKAFFQIDGFCDEFQWGMQERVLLSLAAVHVDALGKAEINAICKLLTGNKRQQAEAEKLLFQLQSVVSHAGSSATTSDFPSNHYPCILIIDERLDHFFWEELNVKQEFCRINSLQSLWQLFQVHKAHIHNGYLNVNISDGGCLINPCNNLPKMEMRMKSYFKYWNPAWLMKIGEKPTQDELFNEFFKRPCYVYAGHGSGLQYVNGKHLSKQQIKGVVFLFGCDSTLLHSNGLYSELVGAHLYYQAAQCPTLVGTVMPCLDSNMDSIATEILSRWMAPKSKQCLPWHEIDYPSWIKKGVIKPLCNSPDGTPDITPTVANTPNYHIGSLCTILARVHQRTTDSKYYNTVSYVCRGLPAWNCSVQAIPKTKFYKKS